MPDPTYSAGQSFRTQFVWRLPVGDFLRAVFEVEIIKLDQLSDKYVVQLRKFVAGRQESPQGDVRGLDEIDREHWMMVQALTGNKITLAFEVDDGRALWLRYETLTGEHNFFHRLNELPPKLKEWLIERSTD